MKYFTVKKDDRGGILVLVPGLHLNAFYFWVSKQSFESFTRYAAEPRSEERNRTSRVRPVFEIRKVEGRRVKGASRDGLESRCKRD